MFTFLSVCVDVLRDALCSWVRQVGWSPLRYSFTSTECFARHAEEYFSTIDDPSCRRRPTRANSIHGTGCAIPIAVLPHHSSPTTFLSHLFLAYCLRAIILIAGAYCKCLFAFIVLSASGTLRIFACCAIFGIFIDPHPSTCVTEIVLTPHFMACFAFLAIHATIVAWPLLAMDLVEICKHPLTGATGKAH